MEDLEGTPALAKERLPGLTGCVDLPARGTERLPCLSFSMFGFGEILRSSGTGGGAAVTAAKERLPLTADAGVAGTSSFWRWTDCTRVFPRGGFICSWGMLDH